MNDLIFFQKIRTWCSFILFILRLQVYFLNWTSSSDNLKVHACVGNICIDYRIIGNMKVNESEYVIKFPMLIQGTWFYSWRKEKTILQFIWLRWTNWFRDLSNRYFVLCPSFLFNYLRDCKVQVIEPFDALKWWCILRPTQIRCRSPLLTCQIRYNTHPTY